MTVRSIGQELSVTMTWENTFCSQELLPCNQFLCHVIPSILDKGFAIRKDSSQPKVYQPNGCLHEGAGFTQIPRGGTISIGNKL